MVFVTGIREALVGVVNSGKASTAKTSEGLPSKIASEIRAIGKKNKVIFLATDRFEDGSRKVLTDAQERELFG